MHCLLVFSICGLIVSAAEPRFLGSGLVPPDARDRNGETIGAIGSGLAYDTQRHTYLFLSDRGPGDGSIDYRPRFNEARVAVVEGKVQFDLVATTILRAPDGKPMTGLSPDVAGTEHPQLADGRWCIDPEAIAIAPDDTIYISDEYGPFLYQFRRDGTLLRTIRPPDEYLPRTTACTIDFGEGGKLASGRVVNRGFEGLALTPDGRKAVLVLQSGLVQDGGKDSPATRVLVLDLRTEKKVAEYRYPFADRHEFKHAARKLKQDDLSVSELLAVDDRRWLVLERDNGGANGSDKPKPPVHKCVYLVELSEAGELRRTLLLDLLNAPHGDEFAAKWEGLALTPPDAKGRRQLLVASDNDFLNPMLFLDGKEVNFSRAKRPQATQMQMWEIVLP